MALDTRSKCMVLLFNGRSNGIKWWPLEDRCIKLNKVGPMLEMAQMLHVVTLWETQIEFGLEYFLKILVSVLQFWLRVEEFSKALNLLGAFLSWFKRSPMPSIQVRLHVHGTWLSLFSCEDSYTLREGNKRDDHLSNLSLNLDHEVRWWEEHHPSCKLLLFDNMIGTYVPMEF